MFLREYFFALLYSAFALRKIALAGARLENTASVYLTFSSLKRG